MAETAKTKQNRLIPSPKELQKALKQSAEQAQRMAAAFRGDCALCKNQSG